MLNLFKTKRKADRARILVVDDEPDLVSTIQGRLEWCKCQVFTAMNGQEGLEKALNEKPDLILLDNSMPVMSGPEMLEQLRQYPELKEIPVIMCTALCDAENISKVTSYGISDYVTKPFDFTELMEKITNLLKHKNFE